MWMAPAAAVPFAQVSCGYVRSSDGWTGPDGNIARESVDIPILAAQRTIRFIMFRTASESWERPDYLVSVA
jgi:hypothetical protein